MNTQEKNRPVYTKQIGAVRASVWANSNDERTYFNVSISRRYRDGDQFKESNTLGPADVACLKEVLIHVANWLSQADDEMHNGGDE